MRLEVVDNLSWFNHALVVVLLFPKPCSPTATRLSDGHYRWLCCHSKEPFSQDVKVGVAIIIKTRLLSVGSAFPMLPCLLTVTQWGRSMEVARERHSHGFSRLTARPPLLNSLVRAVDKSVIIEAQAHPPGRTIRVRARKQCRQPRRRGSQTFIRSLLGIQVSANLFMIVGRGWPFGQAVSCAAIRY